jgi:2-polyprenyl-6-methoxyphenol hydroxylase-like FAD-dependent oxidoreductase
MTAQPMTATNHPMAKTSISIVGAGLSGLTLGRCLQQRGIPAVLYERTSSPASHNYGITLYASTYTPLLQALNVTESAFKSRVAVDAAIGGSGKITPTAVGPGNNTETCFRANRGRLEEWLREGLDVRWSHILQHTSSSPSASTAPPTLHFANGSTIQSALIVGADGPHSSLRKSLLPEDQTKLTILHFVVFNGKRRIDRAVFEKNVAPHMHESTVITYRNNDTRLALSIDEHNKSDKVSLSWTYSRPSRGARDVLHKPNRETSEATIIPDELFDELSRFAQTELSQPFAELFQPDTLRKDRILHWLMRSTCVSEEALKTWTKRSVVFIGDAVHAQPIVGGNGANDALNDGVGLAEWITEGEADGGGWVEGRYESWVHGVRRANERIEEMHRFSGQRL